MPTLSAASRHSRAYLLRTLAAANGADDMAVRHDDAAAAPRQTLAPRPILTPATAHPLDPADVRLSELMDNSSQRTSMRPLACFALASGGKLVLAIGAGELVNGILLGTRREEAIGGTLIGVGLSAAVAAAYLFAADVKQVNVRRGWALKVGSISAAVNIGVGYGLRGWGQATKDLTTERCAFVPLCVGLSTMGFVLPQFFTYSEAVWGELPLTFAKSARENVRQGCGALGVGVLAGWAIAAGSAKYPVAATQTMLTVFTMAALLGFALSTSHIRRRDSYAAATGRIWRQGLGAAAVQ